MTDLRKAIRKVERCLGSPIVMVFDDSGKKVVGLNFFDDQNHWKSFALTFGPPSVRERQLKKFHQSIYIERAKEKYRLQNGRCAHCQRDMQGRGECDHIKARSKGRDDSI